MHDGCIATDQIFAGVGGLAGDQGSTWRRGQLHGPVVGLLQQRGHIVTELGHVRLQRLQRELVQENGAAKTVDNEAGVAIAEDDETPKEII